MFSEIFDDWPEWFWRNLQSEQAFNWLILNMTMNKMNDSCAGCQPNSIPNGFAQEPIALVHINDEMTILERHHKPINVIKRFAYMEATIPVINGIV